MASRTFNLFKLNDGITGLKRALNDQGITILHIESLIESSTFHVEMNGRMTQIELRESETKDHPLARLGSVFSVIATIPDDDYWKVLDHVLTMAFLRGGG